MVYPDRQAVFICEVTPGSVSYWFINGSRLLPEEVRDDISSRHYGFTDALNITARTQYNNTVVQCAAEEIGGSRRERSDNVTLRVQGNLLVYMQNTIMHVELYVYVVHVFSAR